MWIFDTTSLGAQNESANSDFWYVIIPPLISFAKPIRATDGTTVYDALAKGLDDLTELCDIVIEKFTAARDAFNEEEMDRTET